MAQNPSVILDGSTIHRAIPMIQPTIVKEHRGPVFIEGKYYGDISIGPKMPTVDDPLFRRSIATSTFDGAKETFATAAGARRWLEAHGNHYLELQRHNYDE